jgi:hypothetical protein
MRTLWTSASVARGVRPFYTGLDEKRCLRLRRSCILRNPPRGRDTLSIRFEKNIRLVPLVSLADLIESAAAVPNAALVEPLTLSQVNEPASLPHHLPWCYVSPVQPASVRRALRKNGDTDAFSVPKETIHADAKHDVLVIPVVDPDLTAECTLGGREEAQVELISAYRNILYEVLEARHAVRVLKIPVLSMYMAGEGLYDADLPKLTQEALIKGFHRLPNSGKEQLLVRRDGTPELLVELYVPVPRLPLYERTFAEDAWETPTSTLIPKRMSLYPALAPPEQLLQLDGWVGKRPELIEAVQTKGKSLTTGDIKLLDGSIAEMCDVPSTLTIFEDRQGKKKALEKEQLTAAAAGLVKKPPQPLHEGLLND